MSANQSLLACLLIIAENVDRMNSRKETREDTDEGRTTPKLPITNS